MARSSEGTKWHVDIGMFAAQASSRGIHEKIVSVLTDHGFSTEQKLSELSQDVLYTLRISPVQRGKVMMWVQELCKGKQRDSTPTPFRRTSRFMPEPQQARASAFSLYAEEEDSDKHKRKTQEKLKGLANQSSRETLRQATKAMANLDARGMADKIHESVSDFMEQDVRIAVCGRSGTGKSSLVNCILNKRASEYGAAQVGETETTDSILSYTNPNIPKVVICDLPGVGTKKFDRDSYLDDIAFSSYDAFIIVCSARIYGLDIWLAQEAQKEDKPFYFVRSMVDQEIQNAKEDNNRSEEETLSRMRANAKENLDKCELYNTDIFLVSSRLRYQHKWEYPRLMEQLIKRTPQKNVTALAMAMVSCSKHLISQKKTDFQKRIPEITEEVGRPDAPYQERIMKEIDLYIKMFGVSNQDIEKYEVQVSKMENDMQLLQYAIEAICEEVRKHKERKFAWKIAASRLFCKLPLAKRFLSEQEEIYAMIERER